MTRSRIALLAGLLLLVPTLVVGALALRAVRLEESRLAAQAVEASRLQLLAGSESINLALAEVREGMLTTLRELSEDNLAERLESWRRGNPLLRNAFVWEAGRGLLLPAPGRQLTEEEAAFVARYQGLFAGRIPWEFPGADQPPPPAAAAYSSRSELRQLSQASPATAAAVGGGRAQGWRPWFWENRLYLLAWSESPDGRRRYGVELEMMALLSRLVDILPAAPPPGETYALLDDAGAVCFQRGPAVITATTRPLLALPVGPALPHWQVALYAPAAGAAGGGGVRLFGTLLVAIFVVAILAGGGLLLWEGQRHQRDARRKTSFVANVSHELKTPLTTIRMYAELLGEADEAPEKRHRYLAVIQGECQRLTRLVNNVLDFSRLEQGRRDYQRRPCDLAEVVKSTLAAQGGRLAAAGLHCQLNLPAPPLTLVSDRDALEQVLLNLLDNALKYAATGGELQIAAAVTDGAIKVGILDRGPGIPEAHRQKIFDKFHRVDDTLTARQPGSGLGLAISRQLLRDLGGDLLWRLRPGGGSCFEMILPRTERSS
ncbi:MAG: hypothetical protein A2091_08285 [Desulfuromonadales bacterium GWD2_61_12]|nr:MAG: hypothetical protein A2005_08610 [Desulfuromonadales bacterium GWC2_61_20]OGR33694.1 MAG: hypothetical protein A2091_08285 [Desulfuromonadales bacterium GWD2_61_12]HAD03249.1 hypothetical protein [Desulfuromonas sp.]HBT83736.1 hypothetical protein [Desulfuromonas sp.]